MSKPLTVEIAGNSVLMTPELVARLNGVLRDCRVVDISWSGGEKTYTITDNGLELEIVQRIDSNVIPMI